MYEDIKTACLYVRKAITRLSNLLKDRPVFAVTSASGIILEL